jgi:hypothetical protein
MELHEKIAQDAERVRQHYLDLPILGMVNPVTGEMCPVDWRIVARLHCGREEGEPLVDLDFAPPAIPQGMPENSRVLLSGLVVDAEAYQQWRSQKSVTAEQQPSPTCNNPGETPLPTQPDCD